MAIPFPYTLYPCGDQAVAVDFGNVINEAVNKFVLAFYLQIKKQNIIGVKDILPAYSSVTVVYDAVIVKKLSSTLTAYAIIVRMLEDILHKGIDVVEEKGALVRIPVCYERPFCPDLQKVADKSNTSTNTVIQWHCGQTYRVYMLGFLPGFAYMGALPDGLVLPRRPSPRTHVAAGSVGIAGRQTGIYPFESPGGWNIIGQTPLRIFDVGRNNAALLAPGSIVQFYPVGRPEFETIKAAQWQYT